MPKRSAPPPPKRTVEKPAEVKHEHVAPKISATGLAENTRVTPKTVASAFVAAQGVKREPVGREVKDKVKETYRYVWLDAADVVPTLKRELGDINYANDIGWTVLMWAAVEGELDVVKTLIDAGADVTCTSHGSFESQHSWAGFEMGWNAWDICMEAINRGMFDQSLGGESQHWDIIDLLDAELRKTGWTPPEQYANTDSAAPDEYGQDAPPAGAHLPPPAAGTHLPPPAAGTHQPPPPAGTHLPPPPAGTHLPPPKPNP